MHRGRAYRIVSIVGVASLLVFGAVGCSKQAIQADATDQSFLSGAKPVSSKASKGGGVMEPSINESGYSGSGTAPGGVPGGSAFVPGGSALAPGGDQGGDSGGGPTGGPSGGISGGGFDFGKKGGADSESLRGLTPGGAAAEERVGPNSLIAKADPSSAAAQRTEDLVREAEDNAKLGLNDIFFDFDSWKLTEVGKQTISADAVWLKANPKRALTIQGHCDERGPSAYNFVLGEKRAKAVRHYMVELGVKADRLKVTSYGKEQPFCGEHTEECYQQNRRGHLALR